MIHFRYFDTDSSHAYLWEDLIEDLPHCFLSATAIDHMPHFYEQLELGQIPSPLFWVFHYHELRTEGGHYTLERFVHWPVKPLILCVTGGEPDYVRHQLRAQNLVYPNIQVYERSLSHIIEWSKAELTQWERFLLNLTATQQTTSQC